MKLFNELQDKRKCFEYLEALLTYLARSAKTLEIDEIKESVTRYIEDGGVIMQTIAEKLIEQGKQQGLQEGVMKEKKEVVSKGLEANLPIEIISLLSGFSLDEIRQYKALMKMKPATMN